MAIPTVYDTDLRGCAAGLRKIGDEVIPDIGLAVMQQAMEDLFMDLERQTPKGSVKTSPHPGKAKASLLASAGHLALAHLPDALSYPMPGITEVMKVTEGMSLGEDGYISDDAATDGQGSYIPSLDAGLRSKNGRRYGSLQAPKGIFKPSVGRLLANASRVISKAVHRSLNRRSL